MSCKEATADIAEIEAMAPEQRFDLVCDIIAGAWIREDEEERVKALKEKAEAAA